MRASPKTKKLVVAGAILVALGSAFTRVINSTEKLVDKLKDKQTVASHLEEVDEILEAQKELKAKTSPLSSDKKLETQMKSLLDNSKTMIENAILVKTTADDARKKGDYGKALRNLVHAQEKLTEALGILNELSKEVENRVGEGGESTQFVRKLYALFLKIKLQIEEEWALVAAEQEQQRVLLETEKSK